MPAGSHPELQGLTGAGVEQKEPSALEQVKVIPLVPDAERVLFSHRIQTHQGFLIGRRYSRPLFYLCCIRMSDDLSGWQNSQGSTDDIRGDNIRLHLIEVFKMIIIVLKSIFLCKLFFGREAE